MSEIVATLPENGVFINKSKRKENFTMVTNKIFTQNILSAPAMALYMLIAQKITIPGFVLYKTNLRKNLRKSSGAPMGKRAFQTIWDELKKAGYLKQYRIRINKRDESGDLLNGFIYQYELLEEPSQTRSNLINVRLCEELVEDENGNYVVRSMAKTEEESLATAEEIQAVDRMDLVGTPKEINVKYTRLSEEEQQYVKDYYKHPEKYMIGDGYVPDPQFRGFSPEIEWKKQLQARKLRQEELIKAYMPRLYDAVQLDTIQNEDERKIGEEIMDAVRELVAPPDTRLITIGGIGWPQQDVLNNLLTKLKPEVLDRTIYQIKHYDKKITNYGAFIKNSTV